MRERAAGEFHDLGFIDVAKNSSSILGFPKAGQVGDVPRGTGGNHDGIAVLYGCVLQQCSTWNISGFVVAGGMTERQANYGCFAMFHVEHHGRLPYGLT